MATFSGVADVKNIYRGTSDADTITGNNLADRLFGQAGNDTITGAAGDDILYGGKGDDTYTIATGDGHDTIRDILGTDTVTMSGIANGEGVFIKKGSSLLVFDGADNGAAATTIQTIRDAMNGEAADKTALRDMITYANANNVGYAEIKGYFTTNGFVETVADVGGTIRAEELMAELIDYNTANLVFNQGAATTTVRGTVVDDFLNATANGQKLYGGNGNDSYYIDAKTDVVIYDTNGNDAIFFDDNNGGANVYAYTKEGNDLKVTFDDGSGAVVASAIVKNFFTNARYQVEAVCADDDVDLSLLAEIDTSAVDEIDDRLAAMTSTTGVLRGTIVDDRLNLAAAGQIAYGFTGDDEYTVTAGKAIIVDSAGTADILNADHLATETDGVFIRRGNDLIILDGGDDPDGAGGYADADAAVADLTNLNSSQRRTALNNMIKMTDSVTVRNFFSRGEIETINALNNTAISVNEELLVNLIDYRTGLLMSSTGTGKTRVSGAGVVDYIFATADNQKLYGRSGSDIYAIPGGMTDVEIYDTRGDLDKVVFTDADLNGADSYDQEQVGNDLKITVTDAGDGDSSVIIKNFYAGNNTLEKLEDFDAGTSNTLNADYFYASAGDSTLTGNDANEVFYGKAGNDLIYVEGGHDTVFPGDGDDTVKGLGSGYDYIMPNEGSDVYEVEGELQVSIREVDATADDTDKVIFKNADFSQASCAINIVRSNTDFNNLYLTVTDGGSIVGDISVFNQFNGASTSRIEIIEDQYGNSFNIRTGGAVTGTINASITKTCTNNSAEVYTAPDTDTLIIGGTNAENLNGGAGDDTIDGGLSSDNINPGGGNDVILYDIDSGRAAGPDIITGFTIGEDVIRFTTSAIGPMADNYRNQIAIWSDDDSAASNFMIGFGWNEAIQSYDEMIIMLGYDGTSETDATVIEFVTGDTTYTLTDTEIEGLLDSIVTTEGLAGGDLTDVHDDDGDNAIHLMTAINGAW